MNEGAFHEGEVRLQTLTGERSTGLKNERFISDRLPANAGSFMAEQRMVNIAMSDDRGRVWSFIVTSARPFLAVENPRLLVVSLAHANVPALLRELLEACPKPRPIGMVAIDPARGRRFRVNGLLERARDGSLAIAVQQTCPNCPKYIQKRVPGATPGDYVPTVREAGPSLPARVRELIERADTIFTASKAIDGAHDASHRGGNPGFVAVEGNRLTIPDYIGNSMFMTLGNFLLEPAGGLSVVDFDGGRQLNLTGRATIEFADARAHDGTGGRFWTFDVEEWNLEPFQPDPAWVLEGYSRFNPPIG
jgi:predicted pyridoxine 5'-phosphate oxidase superfamily flavin-nucleotide-binding protein